MQKLFDKSFHKIQQVTVSFQRFLLEQINFKNRLIAVKGARGTGKTTLLLQYARIHLPNDHSVLYMAMDDLFFSDNTLYALAETFYKNDGQYLLLDEVHKYPNWSREIKLIYDDFPTLNIVFTSSSILDIYKAESDLSRRAVSYILPELSLREFIALENEIQLPYFPLKELIENHVAIALELNQQIKPVYEFNKYVQYGQYPYFIEGKEEYFQKVMLIINLILEVDLKAVENLDYGHIVKLKKLLYAIATSVPFIPNISKLSEKTGVSRPFMIKALHLLEKAQLIKQIHKQNRGITHLNKPDKLYLNNTNLIYALAYDHANEGSIRETFFLNQLSVQHDIRLHDRADFIADDRFLFEIGGKNKKQAQIKELIDAFIVKDEIEYGTHNIIPLWLFGFLY